MAAALGPSRSAASARWTAVCQDPRLRFDPNKYELTIRQEPKQAWMCGIGRKADCHPIDPPVIMQLRVIDTAASSSSHPASSSPNRENGLQDSANADSDDPPYTNRTSYVQSFLQNPYYFMCVFAKPYNVTALHWLKDGRTRCTSGSVVNSLYALKDPPAPDASTNNGDASGSPAAAKYGPTTASPASNEGFFVFPDLSVRREGSYRLKLSLFEVVGDVRHCKIIHSTSFYVYTAKGSPVWRTSQMLPRRPGIRIRIRKDIRMRGWAGRFGFLRR
ncbi:velvet factor [Mycena galopus ATCC 62051]|nr:velvet factor [Mycena galopus ATCC 62051]